jgi:hypothetical protein
MSWSSAALLNDSLFYSYLEEFGHFIIIENARKASQMCEGAETYKLGVKR